MTTYGKSQAPLIFCPSHIIRKVLFSTISPDSSRNIVVTMNTEPGLMDMESHAVTPVEAMRVLRAKTVEWV